MKHVTKGYGNGFDELPHKQTFRDFLIWWNSESWFPVKGKMDLPDEFPQAA